jgi:hypothetical protein
MLYPVELQVLESANPSQSTTQLLRNYYRDHIFACQLTERRTPRKKRANRLRGFCFLVNFFRECFPGAIFARKQAHLDIKSQDGPSADLTAERLAGIVFCRLQCAYIRRMLPCLCLRVFHWLSPWDSTSCNVRDSGGAVLKRIFGMERRAIRKSTDCRYHRRAAPPEWTAAKLPGGHLLP